MATTMRTTITIVLTAMVAAAALAGSASAQYQYECVEEGAGDADARVCVLEYEFGDDPECEEERRYSSQTKIDGEADAGPAEAGAAVFGSHSCATYESGDYERDSVAGHAYVCEDTGDAQPSYHTCTFANAYWTEFDGSYWDECEFAVIVGSQGQGEIVSTQDVTPAGYGGCPVVGGPPNPGWGNLVFDQEP